MKAAGAEILAVGSVLLIAAGALLGCLLVFNMNKFPHLKVTKTTVTSSVTRTMTLVCLIACACFGISGGGCN